MPKKSINIFMGQGLGNQLFTYSYILGLQKSAKPGKLELSVWFNKNPKLDREFKLGILIKNNSHNIRLRFNNEFIYFLRAFPLKIFKSNRILKIFKIYRQLDTFSYDSKLLSLPNNSFVYASFISRKFVDPVLDTLKKETNAWFEDIQVNDFLNYFDKEEIIVLHIRRGDTVGKLSKTRGLLSKAYYASAINFILSKNNYRTFKIIAITDDLKNSKVDMTGLNIDFWFGPKDLNAVQTLKVFTLSKNFVGSNSTLSWWGVKLSNPSKNFIQVLPEPWLAFEKSPADDALRIPGVIYMTAK